MVCLGLLAGCASPLEQVPRLSDVDVAGAPVADIAEDPKEGSVLGALFGGGAGAAEASGEVEAAERAPETGGLFSRLFGGGAERVSSEAEGEPVSGAEEEAPSPIPDRGSDVAATEDVAGDAPVGGVFARLFRRGETGAVTVDPATLMPASAGAPPSGELGPVTRVCGLGRRELGTQVGASGGFRLFDTIPQATVARPHHITGFADGCPRRFSAALALIGDPSGHEVVRYDRMNRSVPWTEVDAAYETLKSRLCRVPARQPCGARMGQVARSTAIVSAYPKFGTNSSWTEILLHRRKLVAAARKVRQ